MLASGLLLVLLLFKIFINAILSAALTHCQNIFSTDN